jgi:hypothetical protein
MLLHRITAKRALFTSVDANSLQGIIVSGGLGEKEPQLIRSQILESTCTFKNNMFMLGCLMFCSYDNNLRNCFCSG